MGLKALLLDRDKEVFPLLGDIFNVTGHKLLIATQDSMFFELVKSADVDVVIINHSDISAWLNTLSNSNPPLPFFLVDREEEEERLLNMGFSELNFVRKPFNPLELLNKLSYLHSMNIEDAHLLGLVNTLVKLVREKREALVEISGSITCVVETDSQGHIRTDCSVEEILRLLSEEKKVLKVLEPSQIEGRFTFRNLMEFVKTLVEKSKPVISVSAQTQTAIKKVEGIEEIAEDLFRVSKVGTVPSLIKNVYLRIYRGQDKKVAFLIGAGGIDEWSGIKTLVEDVVFSFKEIDAVILLSSDLASVYNVFLMSQQEVSARVIADYSVKRALVESGYKSSKIRTFEDFPSYNVTVATGHRLRFIPINFSPSAGGFCIYEEETGFLFTPEFLSGFYDEEINDPKEVVKLFHRVYMPSSNVNSALVRKVEGLKVSKVLPRYGVPYENFSEVVEALIGLNCGLDFGPMSDLETAKRLLEEVVYFVMNKEEKEVADHFLEEVGRFALIEGTKVSDLYVEPNFVVELTLNSLTNVPTIKPSTFCGVLRIFDRYNVFINPL